MLEHGGRLNAAVARYGIARGDWLDLSTGINPHAYPVPPIPAAAWQRLPEDDDGLLAAAAAYYGVPQPSHLLPLAGSQAAIQMLPRLFLPSAVAVLAPAYGEHVHAWRSAKHRVQELPAADLLDAQARFIVLGQPNNPDGSRFARADLLACAARLAADDGLLVVDEAFIDATPEHSLAAAAGTPGLVVLRSLGKFFGLAGARVGFALAAPPLLAELQERLGPWTLAHPARVVATAALRDHAWQATTRQQLHAAGERLAALLAPLGVQPGSGCALFRYVASTQATQWHEQLAQQGILTRLFTEPPALRFGLPADEAGWARLTAAINTLVHGDPA